MSATWACVRAPASVVRLFGLVALCCWASPAFAQDQAQGCLLITVLDPDGLAVSGARLSTGSQQTETAASGEARICAVDPGPKILVEADEFASQTIIVSSGETAVTVRLELAARRAESTVVTGEIKPIQLREVNRTLQLLNADDPDVPAWSFPDLLKQDSSVDMRERGSDGAQADLSIRGSSFDQVLVLINGFRVNDPQTGHHSMDLPLPFESVQQVEVLHGSGATLYGSDAVGGTVNFVTKTPLGRNLKLMGGLGGFGWNRFSAVGGFRVGAWGQQVSVSRDFSTGFDVGRDFRNLAVSSETFIDESFGSTSILFAYNDRPFGANGFYGPWNSWEETGTKFLSVSQTVGRDGGSGQHRFGFAFRRHNDRFLLCKPGCVFGGTQFLPEDFENRHQTNVYQGNYSFTKSLNDRVTWSAGAQFLSEGIDSNVAGQRRRERGSAFVMFNLRPSDRLTLSLGLREEVWKKWRGETSPTVAVGYWLGRGVKVRGQLGRAFRIPTYTDLYHRDPGNVGNENLVPETAWNYEVGADWYHGSGTKLSAVWFQRRENNTIDWVRDEGSPVFQARNFQELNFNGGEFFAEKRFGRSASVGAGFTLIRASRKLPVNAVSRYTFNFPREQLSAVYRGPLGKYLLVKMRFGAYTREWQSVKPLWDASLIGTLGRWEPFIQASNLLDTSHEAFQGLQQPGRWIRGGVQVRVF